MKQPPNQERIEHLENQWDDSKNGVLKFRNVKYGSGKKVWWKCDKGEDHIWKASIVKRVDGSECPICSGRIIVKSNCLTTTHPELIKEWCWGKNLNFNPDQLYKGSAIKVWWKCKKGEDHIWKASIKNRAIGVGCPICSGLKVVKSNSLKTTHPHLSEEWHETKNNNLTPNEVKSGSDKKVWWKCRNKAEHEWAAQIKKRALRNQGCPFCSGRYADGDNNLLCSNPKISSEWDFKKNYPKTPKQFLPRSNKKVWWICSKDNRHSYQSTVTNRVQGFGCSICAGRKVDITNSLKTLNPKMSKEWHPTKNGGLTPKDIVAGTNKKYWWKCKKDADHEWKTSPSNRKGCPICRGLKVVISNCLFTTHPDISKEWHPTKNDKKSPLNVIAGSHKKVWWLCKNNMEHEWESSIKNRALNRNGCPYCRIPSQSLQELTILFELKKIFPSINPKGYHFKVNKKKWTIDIFIPELRLGIEYDGSYWHRNREEHDLFKNEVCRSKKIEIIRIRESPLKKTSDNDIISDIPFSPKIVVDKVLIMMTNKYNLDYLINMNVKRYLKKETLLNEIEFKNYVQKIYSRSQKK